MVDEDDWDSDEEANSESENDEDLLHVNDELRDRKKSNNKKKTGGTSKGSGRVRKSTADRAGLSAREKILKASRRPDTSSSTYAHKAKLYPRPPMLHTVAVVNAHSATSQLQQGGNGSGSSHVAHSQRAPAPPTSSHSSSQQADIGQDVLLWASIILRDTQLQGLVRKLLAQRLLELCDNMILPVDDEISTNAIGLCQYGMHFNGKSSLGPDGIDGALHRMVLPGVMLRFLEEQAGKGDEHSDAEAFNVLSAVEGIIGADFDKELIQSFVKDVLVNMAATTASRTTTNSSKRVGL